MNRLDMINFQVRHRAGRNGEHQCGTTAACCLRHHYGSTSSLASAAVRVLPRSYVLLSFKRFGHSAQHQVAEQQAKCRSLSSYEVQPRQTDTPRHCKATMARLCRAPCRAVWCGSIASTSNSFTAWHAIAHVLNQWTGYRRAAASLTTHLRFASWHITTAQQLQAFCSAIVAAQCHCKHACQASASTVQSRARDVLDRGEAGDGVRLLPSKLLRLGMWY
jgi:hypothetical protein